MTNTMSLIRQKQPQKDILHCWHRSVHQLKILKMFELIAVNNLLISILASSGGLFAGLLFLIAAFVSIGIHSFFSQHADPDGALLVFRLSDMALMHSLQYQPREEQQKSTNTEFLDEILLAIGLVGELIHSSTGIMCWIATQSERPPIKMELYMLFVFITRILQVVVQAVFILLARSILKTWEMLQSYFMLRALTSKTRREKPGKQFVTFLLIANVSLFFFHTLEGMKSVFGETIATRRARPYATLIVGVAPLVVFYRFHSSVCLAEIWKHCYSNKNILDQEIKNKSKPSDSNDTFQTNISSSDISINSSSSPSSTSSISPSGLSSMLYKP
ncbi:hypothetical protein Mgra_00003447 [Meloidogyne graminicola]|uniref:Uncharacterized protein n=1 Tax=Meloidogyne graminicola TaxID=189291 RepID=A0A8S9ZU65_9BILA|nr:hypothetical protein Mgra_00003447 [Meloidogyne graminicola]